MTEWISVKDKLPENAGHYLIIADWMGVVEKSEYDGKGNWFTVTHMFTPTHWMPLPKPPEENT